MQDFVGVNGIIKQERLAALSQRRNGPGLLYLASHFGAIAANSVVMSWTWGTWWCVPFFLLQGVMLNFLYAPEHECDHHTAFKSRWLNVWVARICGFIIFNPNEDHRWGHYSHHRHTQDWEKDIELADGPFRNARQYLWMVSGFPLIWWKGRQIIRHALGKADDWYLTPIQARAVVRVSRWLVAGYLLVALSAIVFQSWWWLYFWIGPFVLMRWTFHAAHHTFPSVPFHRLPELQKEIENSLGFPLPKTPYFRLHWWHLKALLQGKDELAISAETEAELVALGRLPATK